jgi:putative glutamine amidotransferase
VTRPLILVLPERLLATPQSPGRLAAVAGHEYATVLVPIAARIWELGATAGLLPAGTDAGSVADAVSAAAGVVVCGGPDVHPDRWGAPAGAAVNPDPVRDGFELSVLEAALRGRVPVLGICRGCELINVALGGTLLPELDTGPRAGLHRTDDAARGIVRHPVFLQPEWARRHGWSISFRDAASLHHQGIDRVGRGLEAVAWSGDGLIEAIAGRELPLLGVQWHPELMAGAEGGASEPFRWLAREARRYALDLAEPTLEEA